MDKRVEAAARAMVATADWSSFWTLDEARLLARTALAAADAVGPSVHDHMARLKEQVDKHEQPDDTAEPCPRCNAKGHLPCAYPTEVNREQAAEIKRLTAEGEAKYKELMDTIAERNGQIHTLTEQFWEKVAERDRLHTLTKAAKAYAFIARDALNRDDDDGMRCLDGPEDQMRLIALEEALAAQEESNDQHTRED